MTQQYAGNDRLDHRYPPDIGADKLFDVLSQNPRLHRELIRCGLLIYFDWHLTPNLLGKGVYTSVSFKRADTADQMAIRSLLLDPAAMWTGEDLARALGKNPRNQRVLGKIRRDCHAVRAYERQVARLWRGERLRVYCLDPLADRSLDEIRKQYRAFRRSKRSATSLF